MATSQHNLQHFTDSTVRITGYQFGHNFSSYVPGVNTPRIKQGIYVCATPISNPTEDTPCYPRLSQFFGNQFEKRGVKIAAAKSGADAIVFAIVKYNYRNREFKFEVQF